MAENIKLPGLVDMHVHMREPGATHKEDFHYGTLAALAGGVVVVGDMPNNPGMPTVNPERLDEKRRFAAGRAHCDIGFYYGARPSDDNLHTFAEAVHRSIGLKSYLEITTGSSEPSEPRDYGEIWREWHRVAGPNQPIVLHSEERTIEEALAISAGQIGHPTHVAHVSNRAELRAIIEAKKRGWPVTCGVTPHHLFMTADDVSSWRERMKPPLGSLQDQDFLWENLDSIDVVETDHAPHTLKDKTNADIENPEADEHGTTSYGVPGVQTMLPLLLQASREGKMTYGDVHRMTAIMPRQILGLLPIQGDSRIVVSMEQYRLADEQMHSKCGWTPFAGRMVTGKVIEVRMHGRIVYYEDEFIGQPAGKVIGGKNGNTLSR